MIEIKKEDKIIIIELMQTLMCLYALTAIVFMKFIISMDQECKQLFMMTFQNINLNRLSV